ncbi:MAG: arginine repressor [Clostridia bacterium]|jgi:transcriptional regulator of arginine metabolism|nr:arginine repressor [Clostridia bacterium]NLS85889.1 arginine repressor [Oscillospiraceae bacterium]
MKNTRHAKILELIAKQSIERQEELLNYLRDSGYNVTQATVSRDIRELRLVKAATGDGHYRYVSSKNAGKSAHTPNRFETIFRESVLKADYAGHTVLVKCYTGMANAACEVFDAMVWNDVVGTLSGDDTFFVLMRTEQAAKVITEEIQKYIAH